MAIAFLDHHDPLALGASMFAEHPHRSDNFAIMIRTGR
jgi:hypothetical protein